MHGLTKIQKDLIASINESLQKAGWKTISNQVAVKVPAKIVKRILSLSGMYLI